MSKNISLSELLLKFRNIVEKSQKEVAQAVGIPAPSLSFYETGQRTPPYATLIKLLQFYDAQIVIETDLGKWILEEANSEPTLKELPKKEELSLLNGISADEREDLIAYIRRRRQRSEQ